MPTGRNARHAARRRRALCHQGAPASPQVQTVAPRRALLPCANLPAMVATASPPASPSRSPTSQPEELVQVDTALAVLSKVNLLAESNALSVDIGGSLAKLLYLQPHGTRTTAPPLVIHKVDGNVASALSVHVPELRGTLHFFAFETRNIHQLVRFIRGHWVNDASPRAAAHRLIRATGGGSYKYAATFDSEIGVKLARQDEMACTVAGLNFLLTTVENEVYVYVPPPARNGRREAAPPPDGMSPDFSATTRFVDKESNPFPYLLVNIGSGVSIVKVTGHDKFERVSGSALGGGTFWGLARILLDCATFDDVIRLTHDGNNANVDMLVGDIYGGAYQNLGLDAAVIAASFGKATMRNDSTRPEQSSWSLVRERFARAVSGSLELWISFLGAIPILGDLVRLMWPGDFSAGNRPVAGMTSQFRPQDIALSLLRMVSYNIGQIAYLNARVHNLDRIYFGGNFIRNHPYTTADISFAVDFWSGGKMKALFLRHDGYLGAIGAFIGASSASPTKILEEHIVQEEKKKVGRGSSKSPLRAVANEVTAVDSLESVPLVLPSSTETSGIQRASQGVKEGYQKLSGAQKRRKNKVFGSVEGLAAQDSLAGNERIPPNDEPTGDIPKTLGPKSGTANDWTTVTRHRRRGN